MSRAPASFRCRLVMTLFLGCVGVPEAAVALDYDMVELGPGQARAVNNKGEVVVANGFDSYFWSERTGAVGLNSSFPSGGTVTVRDMNDQGEIVGQVVLSAAYSGFLLKMPERSLVIPRPANPGCPRVDITGISETGVMVGEAHVLCARSAAYKWTRWGSPLLVRNPGKALGVNSLGTVIGQYAMSWPSGVMGFVRLPNGQTISLGEGFIPRAVNDFNVVVGAGPDQQGFVWTEGGGVEALEELRPYDINNQGVIAGNRGGAAIWSAAGGVLNVGPPNTSALAMNDLGWVAGYRTDPGEHAVVFIPQGRPALVESVPSDGYIDPRMEAGGVDAITFVFDRPVYNIDGTPIGIEGFEVSSARNPQVPRTGPIVRPVPSTVDASANPTIVLHLSRSIPVGERTTITARVASAEGVVWFSSIRIGHLPGDLDGNGEVNLNDATEFSVLFDAGDLRADLDGNGQVNLNDATKFGQLWNGTAGHMRWQGIGLP